MKRKQATTTATTTVMMNSALDVELIDAKTVAKLFHISRSSIMRLYYAQEVPGLLVGGQIRFPITGIRKYVDDQLHVKPTKDSRRAKRGSGRDPKPSTVA